MNLICVAMSAFVFQVTQGAECSNDNVVTLAGFNASLNWTLHRPKLETAVFRIYNSLGNNTAEYAAQRCDVLDNSTYSCHINNATDRLVVSLTIFSVTAIHSGNYTFVPVREFNDTGNTSTRLIVIEKPKLTEVRKCVHCQPFEVVCNSIDGQECYIYRWRINSTRNASLHSSNMTENFSNVTCQVCLNETRCISERGNCKSDSCSVDIDPYTNQVMYGPDNIALSRKESDFYLEEHDIFTIDCSANCYPNCIFWWKGYDTIAGEHLNITFESGKAGQYTCYVMNPHTNITLESNSITLHHEEKEDEHKEEIMTVTAIGLAAAVVLVVIIASMLVVKWRKNASNKTDSRRPGVNLQRPVNRDMTPEISRIDIGPLPVPNMQETTCRRHYWPTYQNHARKSRSLHDILDSTEDIFYPISSGISSNFFYSASSTTGWSHMTGIQNCNLIRDNRISNYAEKHPNSVVGIGKKTKRDEHNSDAKSESLNNFRRDSYEQELQGDLYDTVAEVAFTESEVDVSIYDDPSSNTTNNGSNKEQRNARQEESYYDHAIWHVI